MNREEVINALIEDDLSPFNEHLIDMLMQGFRGYYDFSDQELADELQKRKEDEQFFNYLES